MVCSFRTVIDAAILALNHQFGAHNYDQGSSLGTVNIYGSLAENWRGAVGQSSGGGGNSGYTKNYTYDKRLTYLSPPSYLNPGTSSWRLGAFGAKGTGTCPPAVTACGTTP